MSPATRRGRAEAGDRKRTLVLGVASLAVIGAAVGLYLYLSGPSAPAPPSKVQAAEQRAIQIQQSQQAAQPQTPAPTQDIPRTVPRGMTKGPAPK